MSEETTGKTSSRCDADARWHRIYLIPVLSALLLCPLLTTDASSAAAAAAPVAAPAAHEAVASEANLPATPAGQRENINRATVGSSAYGRSSPPLSTDSPIFRARFGRHETGRKEREYGIVPARTRSIKLPNDVRGGRVDKNSSNSGFKSSRVLGTVVDFNTSDSDSNEDSDKQDGGLHSRQSSEKSPPHSMGTSWLQTNPSKSNGSTRRPHYGRYPNKTDRLAGGSNTTTGAAEERNRLSGIKHPLDSINSSDDDRLKFVNTIRPIRSRYRGHPFRNAIVRGEAVDSDGPRDSGILSMIGVRDVVREEQRRTTEKTTNSIHREDSDGDPVSGSVRATGRRIEGRGAGGVTIGLAAPSSPSASAVDAPANFRARVTEDSATKKKLQHRTRRADGGNEIASEKSVVTTGAVKEPPSNGYANVPYSVPARDGEFMRSGDVRLAAMMTTTTARSPTTTTRIEKLDLGQRKETNKFENSVLSPLLADADYISSNESALSAADDDDDDVYDVDYYDNDDDSSYGNDKNVSNDGALQRHDTASAERANLTRLKPELFNNVTRRQPDLNASDHYVPNLDGIIRINPWTTKHIPISVDGDRLEQPSDSDDRLEQPSDPRCQSCFTEPVSFWIGPPPSTNSVWITACLTHVYSIGVCYVILLVYLLVDLVRQTTSAERRRTYRLSIGATAVLTAATVARLIYFVGNRGGQAGHYFPLPGHCLLFNLLYPCITSAFCLHLVRTLNSLNRSRRVCLILLVIVTVHLILTVAIDSLAGHLDRRSIRAAILIPHVVFLTWGTCLFGGYLYSFRMLSSKVVQCVQCDGHWSEDGGSDFKTRTMSNLRTMFVASIIGLACVGLRLLAILTSADFKFLTQQPLPWLLLLLQTACDWWKLQSAHACVASLPVVISADVVRLERRTD